MGNIPAVSLVAAAKITVLHIDDRPNVREAMGRFVNMQCDMRVVASAASVSEAAPLYRLHHPDITVVDLKLCDTGGERLGTSDGYADARVVLLSAYAGQEDVYRALEVGTTSYLFKDVLSEDLVRALRQVYSAQRHTSTDMTTALSSRSTPAALTPREREVIQSMAAGMSNKEIAVTLNISEETAHGYIKNIFIKFGVTDRTSAVMFALRCGIIHLSWCVGAFK